MVVITGINDFFYLKKMTITKTGKYGHVSNSF
jgi:hypothetical protein